MTERNKEPTKAQQRELWEWCGFTFFRDQWWFGKWGDAKHYYGKEPPPIDLNSLFLYAVPIVIKSYEDRGIHTAEAWRQLFAQWLNRMAEDIGKDPVSALYWVLYKVMEAK